MDFVSYRTVRIPGLHDRAPLRLGTLARNHDHILVFPVFMTGLH